MKSFHALYEFFAFVLNQSASFLCKKRCTMNEQLKHYQDKLTFEMDPSDLFDALGKGENIIVIDARRTFAFEKEHIPGAVSFPHRDMNESSTKDLDRNVLYVTYCDGIGCNASTKGALNLLKLGFRVKELIGGLEWWKLDGYSTEGSGAVHEGVRPQCAC
jgi:rhodanese-related sulfurtransferase